MIELRVFVEGAYDAAWVEMLLARAFDRSDLLVGAKACGGKKGVLRELMHSDKHRSLAEKLVRIGLVDSDTSNLEDARAEVSKTFAKLGLDPSIQPHIFFAVPTIESWLFADPEIIRQFAVNHVSAVKRIAFPDEIPLPKEFATSVFGGSRNMAAKGLQIASMMDLSVAITRSPSLRAFLSGVGSLIDDGQFAGVPGAVNYLGQRLLASLIRETNPSTAVIYRTLDGERLTAMQLAEAISEGKPVAREYASELLRVARDLLAREANRDSDR